MNVCGRCGHDAERHWHQQGRCLYTINNVGDIWNCPCSRYRSLGVLIGVRILVILVCVAVLATFEGLIGGAPR